MSLRDKQQEIAAAVVNSVASQLSMASIAFQDGGENVTLAMSVATVGVAVAVNSLVDHDRHQTVGNNQGGETIVPTPDDLLFACLLVATSSNFDANGSMHIEWSHDNLIRTLDQFREMTGRSYEDRLNTELLEQINQTRAKTLSGLDDRLNKFLPH